VVINDAGLSGRSATNGGVEKTTVELVNLCSRMMDLLDAPRDISFFSKREEIAVGVIFKQADRPTLQIRRY
jgi:hypothetical protein